MSRLPPDYDSDPGRWRSQDPAWLLAGDVHVPVAARIVREDLHPVLDVGGGTGALRLCLPEPWPTIVLDASPGQLAEVPHPKVRADALALPAPPSSVGAVTMLWMLYHLSRPVDAIAEARRVLRPGGLFAASASSRFSDPELVDVYPPSTFDAEEAESTVREVFDEVEVVTWDGPLTRLEDHDSLAAYCRLHRLPADAATRVDPPVIITKRGCLVYARKR